MIRLSVWRTLTSPDSPGHSPREGQVCGDARKQRPVTPAFATHRGQAAGSLPKANFSLSLRGHSASPFPTPLPLPSRGLKGQVLSSPVQSRTSDYWHPCPWERSGHTRRGTGSLRQGELGDRGSCVSRTWLKKPRQPWSGWANWSSRRRACPAAQVKWGTLSPPFGA